MYRFYKDGISALTVVDRRRKKNNGLYPVKIEVIFRHVQKYYPTGDGEMKSAFQAQNIVLIPRSIHENWDDLKLFLAHTTTSIPL